MSTVTGVGRLPRQILGVFIWKILAGSIGTNLGNTIKLVEHKLISFVTVIALFTLVTLLIELIRIFQN